MDNALTYFLDLRLRVLGQPEALAIIDRCLHLIALASSPHVVDAARCERELESLRLDLEARFGPKDPLAFH